MEEQTEQDEKTKRIYELGYHIVPTVSEEAVAAEVTILKDVLAGAQAQIISEGFPKFRPLSYPMRKASGGKQTDFLNVYFGWLKFETSSEAVKSIALAVRKNDKILRFIIFKTVRESTLSMPRAPRANIFKPSPRAPRVSVESAHAPVSETELEKSLEKIIAE